MGLGLEWRVVIVIDVRLYFFLFFCSWNYIFRERFLVSFFLVVFKVIWVKRGFVKEVLRYLVFCLFWVRSFWVMVLGRRL